MKSGTKSNLCVEWLKECFSSLKESTFSTPYTGEYDLLEYHEKLLFAACTGDQESCHRTIEEIFEKKSASQPNILQIILPVIYKIEKDWLTDRRNFSDTLFAFWNIEQLIKNHNDQISAPAKSFTNFKNSFSILLTPAPECEHTIGVFSAFNYFQSQGYTPTILNKATRESIINSVASNHFEFIGISVGHDAGLDGLVDFLTAIRSISINPFIRIIIGGNIFTLPKSEYSWIGADFLAISPEDAFAYCLASSQMNLH